MSWSTSNARPEALSSGRHQAAEKRIRLNDGRTIPQLGLGTFKLVGETARQLIGCALDVGYRHLDTATTYGNEADVAAAIQTSSLDRDQVWVTTKLGDADQATTRRSRQAFEQSLELLGLDSIDLYLLHWPHERRLKSWRLLEQLHEEGLARSIGVSNFLTRHLDEILHVANTPPSVNQIEMSPFLYETRRGIIERCAEAGVVIAAYSPLTRRQRIGHPTVVQIAGEISCTPAQVLIRWAIQKGFIVLPRSSNVERISSNADVFGWNLEPRHMTQLDALDEGFVTSWDPETAP